MMPSLSSTSRGQNEGKEMNMWPLGSLFPQRYLGQNSFTYIWVPYQSPGNIKAFLKVNFLYTVHECTDEDNAEGWAFVMEKIFWALQKSRFFSFLITFLSCADRRISSQMIPVLCSWFWPKYKIYCTTLLANTITDYFLLPLFSHGAWQPFLCTVS